MKKLATAKISYGDSKDNNGINFIPKKYSGEIKNEWMDGLTGIKILIFRYNSFTR